MTALVLPVLEANHGTFHCWPCGPVLLVYNSRQKKSTHGHVFCPCLWMFPIVNKRGWNIPLLITQYFDCHRSCPYFFISDMERWKSLAPSAKATFPIWIFHWSGCCRRPGFRKTSCVADRVLVLQPGVRPEPLRWENQVQDTDPPETSRPHVISNGKSSLTDLHHWDPAPLNDQQATVLETLCQTTSKTGTQPHPLAERLPKIIISSQTTQNTPPDAVLPTRKTRSSLIHQNTGTSPLQQEASTTHWINLSHWGQTPKTTGTMKLQRAERRPPNTVS